uniref:TSPO-like protein n=1 Tax=Colobanthus quitensis TaxID=552857 RepID=A0A3Q8UCE3_9CARY|nr:TSPO-like protein [Colobanthus quitensis]
MDTQNLTHRTSPQENEPTTISPTRVDTDTDRKARRTGIATRGLKTMSIAISIPLLLTLTNIYLNPNKPANKPVSILPIWTVHMGCLGSSALMGLCGWIVWAEGGFHRKPDIVGFYLGHIGLGLLWDPVVFRFEAHGLGLCYVLGQCYRSFKEVSKVAGDLVLPCLGWAGLLAFVNLKSLLTSNMG